MKCPMCGEDEIKDHTALRYHFISVHQMEFGDNAEMIRRMGNVGIEIEEENIVDNSYKGLRTMNS